MPNNQFINLEELSKTTQALLSKINEQSNLKVNKDNVKAELETGAKIGSIEGIELYAPEVDTSNFLTYDNLNLANVAFSGDYNDLNNKPTLATVATTNNYNDLSYRPALAIVATSGSYNDLNNKPTIPNVPNWALQSTKPTYTAAEVGALPSSSSTVNWSYTTGGLKLFIGNSASDGGTKGHIALANPGDSAYYTTITPTATSDISINLPSTDGTLALVSQIPVTSVNEETGNVIISKIKTTAASNNVEYNLMGTTSNNNTIAVSPYNQDLLSFAKTTNESRLTIGSTSMPGKIRLYSSTNSASGYTELKSNSSSTNAREVAFPDASGTVALTTDIPSVPSWALAASKPTYTFSELTSHPTTLNDYGITNAYTKTEVDGLVSGVLHYKGTKATVSALPNSGNVTGDVWHVTADGSEWAWDGSDWQELGTAVDLSGYLQTGDIAAWAKAANKPTYTASEVGALASNTTYVSTFNGQSGAITYTPPVTSVNEQTGAVTITASSISAASATHAHGNITSGGDMTATAAIASGDRLVINDESASKLVSSTITFGSSTTQYLANNGTWQNAYDDTALAARVTALEQIPWVTYYTGSSTPSNSQGNNGDLYFQTSQ